MKQPLAALVVLLVLSAEVLPAAEETYAPPGDESADFQTNTVVSQLDNPFGLVIRPGRTGRTGAGADELFVAESGAGRVIRLTTAEPDQIDHAIADFPLTTLGLDEVSRVGPLGLALLTRSKLIVGNCGASGGQEVVSVYTLPEDGSTIGAGEADHAVGPLRLGDAATSGKVDFYSLAVSDQLVYIASGIDQRQGWILKAGRAGNRLEYLQPFIELEPHFGTAVPGGIAIIPRPRPAFLVAANMGALGDARDSQLAYFVPTTGELAMTLDIGLYDVLGLAYSPSGQLYAADFARHDLQAGGVYRLDDARVDGRQACRAVRIAEVVRPVALAFTPDGALYVTSLGVGDNAKQGQLLKITGNL